MRYKSIEKKECEMARKIYAYDNFVLRSDQGLLLDGSKYLAKELEYVPLKTASL
jgi:hypothetical protein